MGFSERLSGGFWGRHCNSFCHPEPYTWRFRECNKNGDPQPDDFGNDKPQAGETKRDSKRILQLEVLVSSIRDRSPTRYNERFEAQSQ